MIVTPSNCSLLGEGLDHPESVCVDDRGAIYAGGEAGQLYRLDADGQQRVVANTGGFLLGIALDGQGCIHACDCDQATVLRIDPDGGVQQRSTGTAEHRFVVPNYGVFDVDGNLYVSDSGDYWQRPGTGCILKIAADDSTTMFHDGPLLFANGLAIDPSGQWLYVVQSTAPNVARIPLSQPNGALEVTHSLPPGTVPDGLAFADNGELLIACYKPDAVYRGFPDGRVEVFCEDPTGELLSRPTNVALHDGRLYIANLGGWHITVIDADLNPAPLHRPDLSAPVIQR